MKLKSLALILTALSAADAANAAEIYNKDGNKLDIYGKVDGRHIFTNNSRVDGDQTYVRMGFKGETQINDWLTGYGQWEYNIQANSPENQSNSWTRLAFAGLNAGRYGSIDYGRNYGILYDVESFTDMLPVYGADAWSFADNYMNRRSTGVATWRNRDFFGLIEGWNVAVQLQRSNEGGGSEGRSLRNANGKGGGVSTSYEFADGFTASAAYSYRTTAQTQAARSALYAGGERAEAWATGLKYDANAVYIAAIFAETRNMTPFGHTSSLQGGGIANKTRNIEVTAQYQFESGLRPALSFVTSKGYDLSAGLSDKDLVKYADIAATYYFNKNLSAYVDHKINLLNESDPFYKANGITTDDATGVGLVYQF